MLGRIFRFIVAYPATVIAALLPLVAVCGYLTFQVGVENNIRIWFAESDKAMKQYDSFLQRFGRDVAVSVVFHGDNLFTEERLAALSKAAKRLREHPDWFEDATSVGEVYDRWKDIQKERFGEDTTKDTAALIERFKQELLRSDLFRGLLVSGDAKAIALNFSFTEEGNRWNRPAALALAREVAVEAAGGAPFDMVGQPVHGAELDRLSLRVKKLYSAIIGVAFVILLFTFRSIGLAVCGILCVVATLFILQAYVYFRGLDLNVVTSAMPTLVIVISLSNVIHLCTEFRQELAKGIEPGEALRSAAGQVFWPCLLNATTTSLGFLSLMTSGLGPIRNLGELSAIGVLLAFIICMPVMTAGISLFRNSVARAVAKRPPKSEEAEFFYHVAGFEYEYRREIVYGALVVLGIAIWSVMHLRIETNPLEFFPRNSEFAQAHHRVETTFTGLSPFSIEVTGKSSMLEESNLRALELIQNFMATDPEIKDSIARSASPADFIKEMNRLARGGGDFMGFIPPDDDVRGRILDGMTGGLKDILRKRFLADEDKTARIAVRANTLSSSEYSHLLERLEGWIEKTFRGELDAQITGVVPLINSAQDTILRSQIQSFSMAILTIFAVYVMLLRNPFASLVVMIANLIPIFVTLGSMYWLNISLNASTAMVASAAIGITVDDSIHFLHRYRQELRKLGRRKRAISATLRSSGKAILTNSTVNAIGFSVLLLSGFMPTVYFGGLLALAMWTAVIGLLVILPAYILVFGVAGKERETGHAEEPHS